MKKFHAILVPLVAAAILSSAAPIAAAEVYTETFTVAEQSAFNAVGWSNYLTKDDSSVVDWAASNTEPSYVTPNDYAFFAPKNDTGFDDADGPGLLFTTEPGPLDVGSLASLSLAENMDGSTGDPASGRFAIRIGGQWYASDFQFTSTTDEGPSAPFSTVTLDGIDFSDGNNWRTLTVTLGGAGTGGITLAGSTVGGTLSGDVTAFGVYAEPGNDGDHFRIDNFTIADTTTSGLAPMTDATFSSPVNNQRELTSFQRDGGGVVYQPVAIATTSATIGNDPGWHLGPWNKTGRPSSPTAAMNDVYVTTHAFALGNDADFSLNTTVNDGDGQVFYLVEHLGNDNGILIEPLDGGGVIAGWSLTLNSSDYAAITTTAEYDYQNEGNPLAGTTFTLADFTGGSGTLTGVTGLRIDGDGRLDPAQIGVAAIVPPANDFTNWISDPAFGLDPTDQDFTDDPDGDGLANGVEAFFGSNPGVSDAGLTQVSMGTNTMTFQHPNPDTPLSDVTGSYEWSLDLNDWNLDDVTVNGTTVDISPSPNDPAANTTTVTCTMTGTIPAQLFVRVVATTP